jgi:hypothetical protein
VSGSDSRKAFGTLNGVSGSARLVGCIALLAGLLLVAPAAQGHESVQLTLNVLFDATGAINVATPDGTPVGVTSGAPTQIPAGYYSIELQGPGGCTLTPYFQLIGPGISLTDNMAQGEEWETEYVEFLQPNSTYTWRNSQFPNVPHVFQTNGNVIGTQAPRVVWTPPKGAKGSANSSIIGSAALPNRGTVTAAVTAAGKITLAYKGKPVTKLARGKYTITVDDQSKSAGFVLAKGKVGTLNLTDIAFVGKRTAFVTLARGTYTVATKPGATPTKIVVS